MLLYQRPLRLTREGFPKFTNPDSMWFHCQRAGMVGIAITRTELTASELRTAAGRTKDARAARRMLAISLVLEGADRTTAAETSGMDRQTLRDRVHRYNAEGLAGLVNRTVPPRRPGGWYRIRWPLGQGRSGPGARRGGARAAEGFAAPHRGGVRRRPARAQRPQAIGGTRVPAAAGRARSTRSRTRRHRWRSKNFPKAVADAILARAGDKPLDVGFQDEARAGQQGTLTRTWAKRGSRARAPRDTRYQWAYLFGAVRSERSVRRGLPRARGCGRAGPALRQHRSDERPPGRNCSHR